VTRTEGETPQVIDVGLVGVRRVRLENGKRTAVLNLTVAGAGDLTASATSFDINAAGQVLARRTQGAAVGAVVSVAAVDLVITTGATVPADLMLLTPQSDGRYRVERIVTSEVVLGVK